MCEFGTKGCDIRHNELAESNPSKRPDARSQSDAKLLRHAESYLKSGRPLPRWLAMALAMRKIRPG